MKKVLQYHGLIEDHTNQMVIGSGPSKMSAK